MTLEVLKVGKVNFILATLLVSKIPLLVFHLCGWSRLCISMHDLSDLCRNAMSPSEPESNSTLQTFLRLVDSVCFSWGMAVVAVAKPLPFTTLRREVDWIFLGILRLILSIWLIAFIGTIGDLISFSRLLGLGLDL